jgi:hypothetical protein
MRHGVDCQKILHVKNGYLHGDDDDTPYPVDGCLYCGRCHMALGNESSARDEDEIKLDFIRQIVEIAEKGKRECREILRQDPQYSQEWRDGFLSGYSHLALVLKALAGTMKKRKKRDD